MALEQPVNDYDVHALYHAMLARAPESAAAVSGHISSNVSAETLLNAFLASEEYARRVVQVAGNRIWHGQDPSMVRLEVTPEQLLAMRTHVRNTWSELGKAETYWSVLSADEFRDGALDDDALERFYASGTNQADDVLSALRRNGADLGAIMHVLDFGCGVARLAEPFLAQFPHYTGVDISPGHLDIARSWADKRQLNADFLPIESFLISDITYDLYYCMIVLQHNPPPIMLQMLEHGLKRVRQGGYAIFQCPAFLYDYKFDAATYLSGAHRHDGIEMHALPQNAVFKALATHGFTPLEVVPDPQIGSTGISYVYLAQKAR